jgi:protocatechuate 3,4-dioxygenase beta subunit
MQHMNPRRKFLKNAGFASLTGISALASDRSRFTPSPAACTLIPSETAGPFPLDLNESATYLRKDIKENKTGAALRLKLKIIGLANCAPMRNVRVNIWHCDKDGLYSGYSQNNNPGQAGLTYLRGYQFSDANGEVEFTTIFPGWYTGRICHIHFQVYVSASYAAISQLTFDPVAKNALYAAFPTFYTKGADPLTYATDNIFSDGYTYQVASLTRDAASGEYQSYLEIAIQGSGTVGLSHQEKEAAKYLSLQQNFPNPFVHNTTIPYTLHSPAQAVKLELWDTQGKKIKSLDLGSKAKGPHQFYLPLDSLGLAPQNYIYQLEVKNANGIYRLNSMMTALRSK